MIGPFDKPAELQIQPIPFELMFQLAEKQQARRDKSEQELGALQGAFASLQEAPGHEDYKRKALAPYQDAIKNFMSKYSDPSDPRAIRELSALKSSFVSDPHVQNIHNSKQTYDKLMPELYKAKQTDAVFTSPVMDSTGKFQANEQLYTPDNLGFIPRADWTSEVNTELSKVHAKMETLNYKPSIHMMQGPNGEQIPLIQEGRTDIEKKGAAEFNKSIDAIVDNIMRQNTDGSKWLVAKSNNDPNLIKQQVINLTIPHLYNNQKTSLSYSNLPQGNKEETSMFPGNLTSPYQDTKGIADNSIETIQDIIDIDKKPSTYYTDSKDTQANKDMLRKQNNKVAKPFNSQEAYNSLDNLTKRRIEHLKNSDPKYINKGIDSFTQKDYEHFNTQLKTLSKSIKVADQYKTFDPKENKAWTDFVNQNMASYYFFDPETKQVIPGEQFLQAGTTVNSVTGLYTNPTLVNIPTNQKYTFNLSKGVTMKDGNGKQKTFLMAANKSEINDNPMYLVHTLENIIDNVHKFKTPLPFLNTDIVIIPEANNSFSIDYGDGTTEEYNRADNPKEYRDKIVELLGNPQIATAVQKLFN